MAIGSTLTVRCGRGGLAAEEGCESGPSRHHVVRDGSDVRVGGRTWGEGRARGAIGDDGLHRNAGKQAGKLRDSSVTARDSRQLATARLQLDYSFDSSRRF